MELQELGLSKHHPWGWVGKQGHSLALRGPHHPTAPWCDLFILSHWRTRFAEKISNFLDHEEEQKREGVSCIRYLCRYPTCGNPTCSKH